MLFRFGVVFLFLLVALPATAQNELCPLDFSAVLAAIAAAESATDPEERLAALRSAQELLADLEAPCTEEPSDDTILDENVIPGKWHIAWEDSLPTCQDGSSTSATDRDFILQVNTELDRLNFQDAYTWGTGLEFFSIGDGNYYNTRTADGTIFEYELTIKTPNLIEGVSTATITQTNCSIPITFTLTLIDPDVICFITADNDVNIRSQPSTQSLTVGTVQAGEFVDITGKTLGSDRLIWWQLGERGWVRSDIVIEAGNCADVTSITT